MSIYPRIVAGTDGSDTAAQAVRRVAGLAGALEAPLVVAAAYHRTRVEDVGPPSARAQMPGEGWVGMDYQAATQAAQDAAAIARRSAAGVQVDTATPEGDPASVLLDLAAATPGSLLATGNQGMGASTRALLGNVPNKITHHPVGDVLVVQTGDGADPAPPRRMLIGTDGSKTAGRAVARGLALAGALGAPVTLLTAASDRKRGRAILDDAAAQAQAVDVTCDVRTGSATDALLDAADDHDLVVVGSKGMTGATRFLLGSVPNSVSHHITTDLLIIKTDT